MKKKIEKLTILAVVLFILLIILTGCNNNANEKATNEIYEVNSHNQELFYVDEKQMEYGIYEDRYDQSKAVIIDKDKITTITYKTGEARENKYKIEVCDFGLDHATNNTSREAFVLYNEDGEIVNAFYPIVNYEIHSYDNSYGSYSFNSKITMDDVIKKVEENGAKIHLVEDTKVEEKEDSAIVKDISGKGLQLGDYFVTYGLYEFQEVVDKGNYQNGKFVSNKATVTTSVKIYTDKIVFKEEDREEYEYTYRIEEHNYGTNINPNIKKGIVCYEGNNEYGGFYPVANNKITAGKDYNGNEKVFVLKKAFTDEELEKSVKDEIAKTHIVLKDYTLRNGMYVTFFNGSIETLSISSTSGKYRISNEVGTFSINENQIALENGNTITVTENNKFTYNGATYDLDKEF